MRIIPLVECFYDLLYNVIVMAEDQVKDTNQEEENTDNLELSEAPVEEVIEIAPEELDNKKNRFDFNVGDTVVVYYKIKEGSKSRVQPFEGLVIAQKGTGQSRTFMVRRISVANVGVERIFPLYSPNIENIIVKQKGRVRRSKLYYLRDKVGKAATKVKIAR